MSVTIQYKVNTRDLVVMRSKLSNLRPLFSSISQTLLTGIDLCFVNQASPWGKSWAKLSPVTLKRRRGSSAHILIDTGVLSQAVIGHADSKKLTIGVSAPASIYAGTQQFGAQQGAYGRTRRNSPIPWGDIPARPFLPIRGNKVDLPSSWLDDIYADLDAFFRV